MERTAVKDLKLLVADRVLNPRHFAVHGKSFESISGVKARNDKYPRRIWGLLNILWIVT